MPTKYDLTSQPNTSPNNILLAKVSGQSGESLMNVEPLPQYQTLYVSSITANTEKFFNLTGLGYNFIIETLLWANVGSNTQNTNTVFKTYFENNLIGILSIPSTSLKAGFKPPILPITPANKMSITSESDIPLLYMVVKPVILLGNTNIA